MSRVRQLSAIMFADISGYTALMQESEEQAALIRDKLRKVLEEQVKNHHGRIVQFSGDGALCIFNSALEAVIAAIGMQKEMLREPKVPLRIGIHSGDVVLDQENIYGDGVNIASRIESFAVPGGIFISGKVYEEIRNHKDIQAVSMGKFELKNVSTPVEIFAISNPGLVIPSPENLAGKGKPVSEKKSHSKKILIAIAAVIVIALTILAGNKLLQHNKFTGKEKSIAVLPFKNLSGDKDDEYFTEGMMDEILAALSKMNGLKVFSRTSTTKYKNTSMTMKEIGAELGVETLLEGSVRKVGDQLRVIVQLINAQTDNHIWAETYDRQVKDIFAIQSEIARQIADELDNKLTPGEKQRIEQKPTANLQAYDLYLRGNKFSESFWNTIDMKDAAQAVRLYRAAISLDPNFVEPYAGIIHLYTKISWHKLTPDSYIYLPKAKGLLDTVLAMNIDKPVVHYALAFYRYMGERDYEGALAECDILLRDDPNNSDVLACKAYVERRLGRWDDAIEDFHKTADRNPNSFIVFSDLAETYTMQRRADEALIYIDKAIAIQPEKVEGYLEKAFIYASLKDNLTMAREVLNEAKAFVDPNDLLYGYDYIDLHEGNYNVPLKHYLQYPDTILLEQGAVYPNAQWIAIIYRLEGNASEAKKFFAKERDLITARLQSNPDDYRLYGALGIAYAGLGERQLALDNGNRARELLPLSKDALMGIYPLENLALIHTLLGNQDEAIDILEQLLKLPFGWLASNSIPLLKTSPYWVPLRDNPRFKKLVGKK